MPLEMVTSEGIYSNKSSNCYISWVDRCPLKTDLVTRTAEPSLKWNCSGSRAFLYHKHGSSWLSWASLWSQGRI